MNHSPSDFLHKLPVLPTLAQILYFNTLNPFHLISSAILNGQYRILVGKSHVPAISTKRGPNCSLNRLNPAPSSAPHKSKHLYPFPFPHLAISQRPSTGAIR